MDDPVDDPEVWAGFSRPEAEREGVWESHMVIEGMHCAACALTVESALQSCPGVLEARVSAGSRRARVLWDAAQARPSRWMQAVQRAGYEALPAQDAWAVERRRAETRRALWRWAVAGFCMMQVMMYAWPAYIADPRDLSAEMEQLLRWASWVLTLPVMFFSCAPFFKAAWRDVTRRQISMDLPVALGIVVTFVVSTVGTFEPQGVFGREVYFDSLTMFVFFLLTGRWLELRLRDRTAGALDAILNRLPDSVWRRNEQGDFERVAMHRMKVGDVLRVAPGEAFPADGVLVDGRTQVDEALLTGESEPLARGVGQGVIAGSHNLAASVLMQVLRTGRETRYAEIVALMEQAATDRPRLAQWADRVARPFLWGVLMAAAAAALWNWSRDPEHAIMAAVAVLVVTCPCALSLATPAAMLAAAGALARQGVLVRRLGALESLAQVDVVVFDKTGTLTQDRFALRAVQLREGVTRNQALALAALLAEHSLHPISRALAQIARTEGLPRPQGVHLQEVREEQGRGLSARGLRLGSAVHCGLSLTAPDCPHAVLCDELGWLATFELGEVLRPDALSTVQALRDDGLDVVILSGDSVGAVQRVVHALGMAPDTLQAFGACTPQDKLTWLQQAQAQGRHVAVVGDGLNDGPALAGAHASFAFGRAVPLAQSQADFVVLGEQLSRVFATLRLARRTQAIVKQNLVWAVVYNAACVPLAIVGYLPAWLAGLGMASSSLLVVLNALRLARP